MIKNLKIVDLSTVLAGPSVGSFFAELGAAVLKIENALVPDVTRSWKLGVEDSSSSVSAYFASVNYSKSYLSLNLKAPDDRATFLAIVSEADILLSNFKMGDQQKMGISDEVLFTLNPKLIHGKISGFGSDSDRVAYDLILQAETGMMSMNGTADSGPIKMPVAFIDVLAAHHLKEGLLIALLTRDAIVAGRKVEVSLYDAAVCSLMNQASSYLMAGVVAKPIGSLHPNIAPYGELFQSKDGKLITFAIGSRVHFEKLCHFLARLDLLDRSEYQDNQARVIHRIDLARELQEELIKYDSQEIHETMLKQHVPFAVIKQMNEVFEDRNAKLLIREEEIEGVQTKRMSAFAFKIT